MYDFDASSLVGFIQAWLGLVWGALRLDPEAYRAVLNQESGPRLALVLVLVSGLSLTLGHSAVLFANRVRPRRFLVGLIAFTFLLALTVLAWAVSIWFIADIVFDSEQPISKVLAVVNVSYAPYLLGFLILLPYLGTKIEYLLRIWVLFGLVIAVGVVYQGSFWGTTLCLAAGWLLMELLARLPILRIRKIDDWLWRATTGREERQEARALADEFASSHFLAWPDENDDEVAGR